MTSRNAGSVRTRTVGSALYNMCVQTSNIISSNVSFLEYASRSPDASSPSPDILIRNFMNGRSIATTTNPSTGPATPFSLL